MCVAVFHSASAASTAPGSASTTNQSRYPSCTLMRGAYTTASRSQPSTGKDANPSRGISSLPFRPDLKKVILLIDRSAVCDVAWFDVMHIDMTTCRAANLSRALDTQPELFVRKPGNNQYPIVLALWNRSPRAATH